MIRRLIITECKSVYTCPEDTSGTSRCVKNGKRSLREKLKLHLLSHRFPPGQSAGWSVRRVWRIRLSDISGMISMPGLCLYMLRYSLQLTCFGCGRQLRPTAVRTERCAPVLGIGRSLRLFSCNANLLKRKDIPVLLFVLVHSVIFLLV